MGAASAVPAQTVVLAPQVVTAARATEPLEQVPFSVQAISGDELRANPATTLDGALRSVPEFSLFRRSDSLTANPTAQGLSLRGLGPSGASRSLIVLDGVPLNDPFGGWVPWTLVPREALARVELVRGGGATAWGNSALGGVVQFFTAAPDAAAFRGSAADGDFGTRDVEFAYDQPVGRGSVQLLGRAFATDGFSLVAPERRGPIDVPAATHHDWLAGRWRQPLGENLAVTVSARTFTEERNNGTPYQRNASRANLGSLTLTGQPTKEFSWNGVAYGEDEGFSSTFSSVNATRTAETPASDQFAVPATAAGLAWTGTWLQADGGRTSGGFDARSVRGETREHFTFVNGAFTRLRVAGGTQAIGGLFLLHEQPLGPALRLTAGVRLDRWAERDGHRRESDLAGAVFSRDDHDPDRAGTAFSPSVGGAWNPVSQFRIHAAAQQAFRRPTLNELYRPFRQGANVTEANPDLRTERVTTAEFGADWHDAAGRLTLAATAFWNELRDAVGNVTLARGPGTFPLFGAIAAGGVGRERLNLDRTRVQGVELSARWRVSEALAFNAAALLNDPRVTRAAVAPALVGNQVAQDPRRVVTLGATWSAPGRVTVVPRLRWIGRQFEDDENTLILGEVAVVDLGLTRPLGAHAELFLNAENLGNARIETGRSVDDIVNTGTPRLLLGGVHLHW